MTEQDNDALAALMYLADKLGLKLVDQRTTIATPSEEATARMYDGSLEAKVIPTQRGEVTVETPRASGVLIRLVDHTQDVLAPEGSIYEISAYTPGNGHSTMLNGDVYAVYVGRNGIILGNAAIQRAKKLLKD